MLAGLVAILSIKRAAVGATFDPEISIQALVTISLAQKRHSTRDPGGFFLSNKKSNQGLKVGSSKKAMYNASFHECVVDSIAHWMMLKKVNLKNNFPNVHYYIKQHLYNHQGCQVGCQSSGCTASGGRSSPSSEEAEER